MEDDGVPRRPGDGTPMPLLPGEIVSPSSGEFELVCDIWSSDAHMAREYARQAAAIAELARRRSVVRDADFGSRGGPGLDARALRPAALADVSDDFVSELALIRTCSEAEAGRLAAESVLLTTKLAATWAELFAGRLTIRKARILLDLLGDASDAVAVAVQARVLSGAETCPPSRLGDRVRYHLYRVDAEAKERRRKEAERRADVHVERTADDLGRLVIEGPLPAIHAARDAIDQYARWMRADGDDRPIGVLRSTAALDLVLRPWDTSRPPVTAHLVVHASAASLRPDAPPGAPPAELDGQLITAARCRALPASLDMLGSAPARGSVGVAIDAPGTGETVAVATWSELRRGGGRGRCIRRRESSPAPPCAAPTRPALTRPLSRTGRVCGRHLRPAGTGPPPRRSGWSPSAIGTAACLVVAPGPDAATSTTVGPTPTAGRPPAGTCAVCAGGTTGSRLSLVGGPSPCTPTVGSSSAPRRASPGAPARPAGAMNQSLIHPGSTSSCHPIHFAAETSEAPPGASATGGNGPPAAAGSGDRATRGRAGRRGGQPTPVSSPRIADPCPVTAAGTA